MAVHVAALVRPASPASLVNRHIADVVTSRTAVASLGGSSRTTRHKEPASASQSSRRSSKGTDSRFTLSTTSTGQQQRSPHSPVRNDTHCTAARQSPLTGSSTLRTFISETAPTGASPSDGGPLRPQLGDSALGSQTSQAATPTQLPRFGRCPVAADRRRPRSHGRGTRELGRRAVLRAFPATGEWAWAELVPRCETTMLPYGSYRLKQHPCGGHA